MERSEHKTLGLILCEAFFYKQCGWSLSLIGGVCISAGPRRCLALSPLQAAAAGPHQAQPVDAAGRAHTASQEIQTGMSAKLNTCSDR